MRRSGSGMCSKFLLLLMCSFLVSCSQPTRFYAGGLSRLLQVQYTHACDNQQLTIDCPARTVISLQYAKYGRSVPLREMCPPPGMSNLEPHGDSPMVGFFPLMEDVNCIAVRSLEVMLDLCEHQPSCSVLASPDAFTQDPCPDTPKYLEVHYKCRPDEFEHKTICENQTLTVSCPRAHGVAFLSAAFGRTSNGTDQCGELEEGDEYMDCHSEETLSEISRLCHGKRYCRVLASQSVFGDPCLPGTRKYLSVSYACVPRKILKKMHHKTGKKKKKKKKKKNEEKAQGEEAVTMVTETTSSRSDQSPSTTSPSRQQSTLVSALWAQTTGVYLEGTPLADQDNKLFHSASSAPQTTPVQVEVVAVWPDETNIQKTSPLPDEIINQKVTSHPAAEDSFSSGSSRNPSSSSNNESQDGERPDVDLEVTESVVSTPEEGLANDDADKSAAIILGSNLSASDHNTSRAESEQDDAHEQDTNVHGDLVPVNEIYEPIKNLNPFLENSTSLVPDMKIGATVDSLTTVGVTVNPILTGGWSPEVDSNDIAQTHRSRSKHDPHFDPEVDAGNQNSRAGLDFSEPSVSENINIAPDSGYVTERNLTVLCVNLTQPDVRWVRLQRPNNEFTIGFLRDWFSTVHFLQLHQEKAWLYFTLGICFGIILMLVVMLIKICLNFHRNIRARLDVSEPTHRSTLTNNHSSLDAPMLEHSDSVDRIEVVRFSPRNTLRSQRTNSHHRDLVNYYG